MPATLPTPDLVHAHSHTLDTESLARLRQLDPSGEGHLLQRVLRAYAASLMRLREQLVQSQVHGSGPGLRMEAHTLKSSSASIGALALSSLCARVEMALRDERHVALPPLVLELQSEIDRVDIAVRQLLAE